MTEYTIKEYAVKIPIMDDLIYATIRNRIQELSVSAMREMNTPLYGDTIPWVQKSLVDRIKIRINIYKSRITDAWGVLIGRYEIGDGW